MEEATLSIGELAARAGISVSALRYYERIGLLPAAEREQGRRRFPAATVRRLEIIGAAKAAGLSLADVGSLLAAVDAGAPAREPLRALAAQRLPEAEARLARASSARDWLTAASACRCASLEDCALFAV
jgi:MerR family transcriptional regulator, redox-sensitive transcriptional activator SoxR